MLRVVLALIGWLIGAAPGMAQSGALDITVKASPRADAPDGGKVRLYAKSKALVIGIDAYTGKGWPKLSGAIRDADAVAVALKAQGFEVTVKRDLKADDLDRTLKTFFVAEGADPNARLFLWFAGHGHTIDGEGYIVPADAEGPDDDSGFRLKAISMRRFGEYMREAKAKHVMAIFDSCFSGSVFNVSRSTPPAAITLATAEPVRQFVSSGEAEQLVSDDGTFRRLFLDALAGKEPQADANGDGYITGTELGLFLHDKLTNLTRNKQTPRYGKLNALGYDRGDFVFEAAKLKVPESAAAAASPPSNATGYVDYVKAFEAGQPVLRGSAFSKDEMGPLASSVLEGAVSQLKGSRWQGGDNWAGIAFDADGRGGKYGIGLPGEPGRFLLTGVLGDGGKRAGSPGTRAVARPSELILLGEWREDDEKGGFILRVGTDEIKLLWGPRFLREAVWKRDGGKATADKMAAIEKPRAEPPSQPAEAGTAFKPGQTFRDCTDCPEMVVVPSGEFTMGSPASEAERSSDEGPQRKVTIRQAFAVGKFEVTFAEWDACVAAGSCKQKPEADWGRGRQPVMHVSWDDTQEYVAWLSKKTGKTYRLLTEAEWEYAARGGTTTPFSTGRMITPEQANFDGNYTYGGSAKGTYRQKTVDVGTFKPNAFGLHDMHGNVWEWVQDCYKDSYAGAPTDGRSVSDTSGCRRVLRGGSWSSYPQGLRSANRSNNPPDDRFNIIGFRLARTLIPNP